MRCAIRPMVKRDKGQVIEMMREFYSSPAVYTNGSEQIFEADVESCIDDTPFLEGYVLESDGVILGYAMLAKSFSTEFGKPCIWVEDIYLKEQFRGQGIAGEFFDFIKAKYTGSIFRLEVEAENESAIKAYKKQGFEFLPYTQMKGE